MASPSWLITLETKIEVLRLRQELFQIIRKFFEDRHFLEVETPMLVPCPGLEPHLKVFKSRFEPEDPVFQTSNFYLATSPEYAMKKLLAAKSGNIFQICKCFRNGEFLGKHNPEFTMLEWYRTEATYENLILDIEVLFQTTAKAFGLALPSAAPFPRLSIFGLFQKHLSLDLNQQNEPADFCEALRARGMVLGHDKALTWSELFTHAFVERIEPHLPTHKPYFLIDYPKPAAALAQVSVKDGVERAERFEFYFGKTELANGWTELRDSREQAKRFGEEIKERRALYPSEEPLQMDHDFLKALDYLPPCAGVALGLDRLAMVLFQKSAIESVLAFPFKSFPPYRS